MRSLLRFAQVVALVPFALGMCQLEAQTCCPAGEFHSNATTSAYCRSGSYYTGVPYNVSMSGLCYCPTPLSCPIAHYVTASALAYGACGYYGLSAPVVGIQACPGVYCYNAYYQNIQLYWGLIPVAGDKVVYGTACNCSNGCLTPGCH